MNTQTKKIKKFIPALLLVALTPSLAFAQGLSGVIVRLNDVLATLLPFLVSLGVVYFVWGIVQYFIGDSDEAKKKGKDRIMYGIIGLAVIISVWGLVYILTDTFGLGADVAPDVTGLISTPEGGSDVCTMGPKLQNLLDYMTCIIGKSIIPFIFALAILMFVWGAVKFFLINSDEEKKRQEGKQFMLWGIIALAVMISVWGLVAIVGDTFGVERSFIPEVKP